MAGPALVQDTGYSASPVSDTVEFSMTATTAGNTLTLAGSFYVSTEDPAGIVSVTDSASNTWTYATSDSQNPPSAHSSDGSEGGFVSFVAYCLDAASVTSITLTMPNPGGSPFYFVSADASEWSGITGLDTAVAGAGTAAASSPAAITLSDVGELVIGSMDHLSGTVTSTPAGATELSSTTGLDAQGYQVFAGDGSQGFQWEFSESSAYTVALLALQPVDVLTITTSSLPVAQLSQPYTATLEAVNGTPPYTWTISSGSLPAWATLAGSTGVISGTAPGGGTGLPVTSFTVKVTDAASNTDTKPLSIGGAQPVGSPSGGPWTLVFADEFTSPVNGPVSQIPRPAVWADHLVWGDLVRAAEGVGDWSWASHNKAGLSIADSVLSIIARFESPYEATSAGYDPLCPDPTDAGETASYTSGIATTAPGFACSYGYFEASISIPVGSDIWPSFFMVSRTGNWGPEIDIMEFKEGASTSTLWTQHSPPTAIYTVTSPFADPDIDTDYHVWGMRWSPDDVTFFLDGVQYGTYTTSDNIPSWPMVVQLVMQIPQSDTSDGFPCDLNHDYVRAWVVSGVPAQPVITSVSPPSGIPSSGSIEVAFNAVAGATAYRATSFPVDLWAYYIDNDQTNPDTPAPVAGPSSPLTISGFTDGVPYVISVAAVNATGYSIESKTVPALPPTVYMQPPGALPTLP
jgi:beta-glucanase (GH16 family)